MVRPSDARVKVFGMAECNTFTPEVQKAVPPHFRFLCCCWQALGLEGGER